MLVQFLLFALYFLPWNLFDLRFPLWIGYLGITGVVSGILVVILGILNLNDNLSPFPSPKNNSVLIQNGIYKYVRHPIYSGILIALTGYALLDNAILKLVITAVLGVVFYFKSNFEEELLENRYVKYKAYKRITGRFFPKRFK